MNQNHGLVTLGENIHDEPIIVDNILNDSEQYVIRNNFSIICQAEIDKLASQTIDNTSSKPGKLLVTRKLK